jgi:hypothetical protein
MKRVLAWVAALWIVRWCALMLAAYLERRRPQ